MGRTVYFDSRVAGPGTGAAGAPYQSVASVTQAHGDVYLFAGGATMAETLTLTKSNITLGRYGVGDAVLNAINFGSVVNIAIRRGLTVLAYTSKGATHQDNCPDNWFRDIEDCTLHPTVPVGLVRMRNPLDGAGIWLQGGRTFDGAPLDPGRVPIGACRPMMRMR